MKRCFASAVLAIFFGASGAWAQNWQCDIPFPFHVGELQLNAGSYSVMAGQPYANMVTLLSRTSAQNQAFTAVFSDKHVDHSTAVRKVVFNRYGPKEYFLSEIWDPSYSSSKKALKSAHELVTSKLIAGVLPESVVVWAVMRLPYNHGKSAGTGR